MGATQVAEGPLIKHVPGGYAEWRAKESGLPPARLHSSEGEWWGKLVGPTDTTTPDPILGDGGIGDGDGGAGGDGIVSSDPNFIQPDPNADQINWDFYDDKKIDPYELKTYHTDWDVNFELPEGHGWGTPDATLPYSGGLGAGDGFRFHKDPGMTDPPMIGPQPAPEGYQKPELGEPIVIRPGGLKKEKPRLGGEKPFRFYDPKWNPDSFSNRVKGITTDILGGVESMSDAIVGKTQFDQYPRPPKEKALGRLLGKWKDLVTGRGEEGFLLWETQGVPSSLGDRTPFGPDVVDALKNLDKVIKNEHNVKTQEYGKLQVEAIMNMAKLIAMYGPIGAVPATAVTLAKDIMSGFKNAFADHPEFRGNPAQDLVHGTTWVLGQTLEKTYNATLAKVIGKIDSEKLKEQLSKLNIVEGMKAPAAKTGLKITYTPPVRSRLSPRGGEPKMSIPDFPPPGRINPPQHDRGQERGDPGKPFVPPPHAGQTISPVIIQGPQPQGQTKIETFGGASPIQRQVDPEIVSKTIVPQPPEDWRGTYGELSPVGYAAEPLPKDDRLTQNQREIFGGGSPTQLEIEELADQIIGEAPKGEPFDPEEVERINSIGRVDPDAVRPKTERRFTPEEQQEFNRQQRLKEQAKGDAEDERLNKALFDSADHPDLPEVEAAFERGEIDAETMLKIRQQVGLERRQNDFKENGKFKDDATNEAFTKGAYNWLEHGTADYTGKVDTNEDANAQAIGVLEKAIGDLNYYYDGLERELEQGDTEGLREVQRERDDAVGEYQRQLDDIQISQASGEGLVEFQTQSAVGIYLNNPGITAEEAVKQALSQAKGAGDYIYDENREDSQLKAANFWSEITGKVTDQIGNITQKTSDAKNANDAAANKEANEQAEASGEVAKGIKDKSNKQLAKNRADAKKFTEEMRAYYEKLAETEPLLGAKGAADLAKLDVTGKILYSGDDGGLIQVKNKDGKVVSYAYVDPETKKNVDELMGGWINDDDPYLGQKGILAELEGSPATWSPDPKPDDPGE